MRVALLIVLLACGGSKAKPIVPLQPVLTQSLAVAGGLLLSVCTEAGKEVVTTCEYKAEYACYADAACERQGDGTCGWTQTPKLTDCLAHPAAGAGGSAPQ